MQPRKARVAIINDRADLRKGLRASLELDNIEVVAEAGNMEESRELVRRLVELGANVLFLDANLGPTNAPSTVPGADGAELFKLTRDLHGEKVRVIGNSMADPIVGADIPILYDGDYVGAIERLPDPSTD